MTTRFALLTWAPHMYTLVHTHPYATICTCTFLQHLDPLFACFLESLGQFYSSSAEHLATLVGRHGGASESSEITMQWLSAAQVRSEGEGEA